MDLIRILPRRLLLNLLRRNRPSDFNKLAYLAAILLTDFIFFLNSRGQSVHTQIHETHSSFSLTAGHTETVKKHSDSFSLLHAAQELLQRSFHVSESPSPFFFSK